MLKMRNNRIYLQTLLIKCIKYNFSFAIIIFNITSINAKNMIINLKKLLYVLFAKTLFNLKMDKMKI